MVYDSVNNPAAGGSGSDICSYSYCCADTDAHSGRANTDPDTRCNSYTYAGTYLNTHTDVVADFYTLSIRKCEF